MNRFQRDTVLGIVFFGTMAFLLWATVNLTDVSLGKQPPLLVRFRTGGGIRVGDPVLLLGKGVGKVGAIDILHDRPDNRAQLRLMVQEDLHLTVAAKIEIQDNGVLGGKQVYVDPGQGEPWPPDRELIGTTATNPLVAAGEFFDGSGPSGAELKGLLTDMRHFVQNLDNPETSSVGALVNRRELYDDILGSVQSLRRIFQSVEDGEGFLGRFIKDTNLRDDAVRIVANLARVSEQLNGTDSTLGRLLNDREMSDHLARLALNLDDITRRMTEGKGFIGRILTDEELGNKLANALNSLANVLQKADDPTAGPLGALLADQDMKTDFKLFIANLRSVSDKIDNGKGMLSVLINDEDMGIRLRRILNQVSRVLEDAREAAPIGNFVQVLLGAF
jgi:phospholipid/cholesterol/gamma-HCH transport system substrate-binding protein